MLVTLFVVAVLAFTVYGVRSGRITGRSCCSGPWPPDDLTDTGGDAAAAAGAPGSPGGAPARSAS